MKPLVLACGGDLQKCTCDRYKRMREAMDAASPRSTRIPEIEPDGLSGSMEDWPKMVPGHRLRAGFHEGAHAVSGICAWNGIEFTTILLEGDGAHTAPGKGHPEASDAAAVREWLVGAALTRSAGWAMDRFRGESDVVSALSDLQHAAEVCEILLPRCVSGHLQDAVEQMALDFARDAYPAVSRVAAALQRRPYYLSEASVQDIIADYIPTLDFLYRNRCAALAAWIEPIALIR